MPGEILCTGRGQTSRRKRGNEGRGSATRSIGARHSKQKAAAPSQALPFLSLTQSYCTVNFTVVVCVVTLAPFTVKV